MWIRQGIKARRTRNEGRVRALEQLRIERGQRRERTGDARIAIVEAERSGKLVADAEGISFAYGDKKIIDRFSTTIIRGDRVGIIGPNGSGKTTLLKVLLGELTPQKGRVRLGAGLKIAYFDQLRAQLDDEPHGAETAWPTAATPSPWATRHATSSATCRTSSSPPSRSTRPSGVLSGGERNRLLLARLFSVPSNVLVLDEPTNDLDMETLALLEERLLTYSGTILLVSHDRDFLNNVVTSTIVFEGGGRLSEYVGGYDDWLRQRPEPAGTATAKAARKAEKGRGQARAGKAGPAQRASSPTNRPRNWKRCPARSRPSRPSRRNSSRH